MLSFLLLHHIIVVVVAIDINIAIIVGFDIASRNPFNNSEMKCNVILYGAA